MSEAISGGFLHHDRYPRPEASDASSKRNFIAKRQLAVPIANELPEWVKETPEPMEARGYAHPLREKAGRHPHAARLAVACGAPGGPNLL